MITTFFGRDLTKSREKVRSWVMRSAWAILEFLTWARTSSTFVKKCFAVQEWCRDVHRTHKFNSWVKANLQLKRQSCPSRRMTDLLLYLCSFATVPNAIFRSKNFQEHSAGWPLKAVEVIWGTKCPLLKLSPAKIAEFVTPPFEFVPAKTNESCVFYFQYTSRPSSKGGGR